MTRSTSERMRAGARASVGAFARVLAVALGLGFVWFVSSSVGPGVLSADALVATVAVVAAASSVALAAATGLVLALVFGASGGTPPSAAAAVELPATITQSRPDAPGNPQPRAPGHRLAVA